MGQSIKKDIATSLTSLIFVVIFIGGFFVTFPFLELGVKKILILFGVVFFLIILNFTHKEESYFKKYVLANAIIVTFALFLNIPNSSANYEKYASPIQINSSSNPFIILGNNITIQKETKTQDSRGLYTIKPIG